MVALVQDSAGKVALVQDSLEMVALVQVSAGRVAGARLELWDQPRGLERIGEGVCSAGRGSNRV